MSGTNVRELPYGVADLYFQDAARKSQVERQLRDTFSRWSYSEIIPPTFEYYEPLAQQASANVREEVYRFFDRDGRMLALRADPTLPIARIAATKLAAHRLPLRLSYISNVFRYEEPKAALRREFTQAGVELVGVRSPAADAEAIALAISALREVGLEEFRVRVGAMDFVGALLGELDLGQAREASVKSALERKSEHALLEALNGSALPDESRRTLARLPQLAGRVKILNTALAECALNEAAREALLHLRRVSEYLDAQGLLEGITFDLAMVRGMEYYTGVVFEIFAPGIGFALGSGGRYDKLLAQFGRDLPAIGFAIGIERVLAALAPRDLPRVDLAPRVVVESSAGRELMERIARARGEGLAVELDLTARPRAELVAYARERGAAEVWFGDGTTERLK